MGRPVAPGTRLI
jgi:hypothetical protein